MSESEKISLLSTNAEHHQLCNFLLQQAPDWSNDEWDEFLSAVTDVRRARNSRLAKTKKQHWWDRIVRFYYPPNANFAEQFIHLQVVLRALRFVPALALTFGIELFNGSVLDMNAEWLANHFILVAFIPIISAMAGNIGLQTSSSISALINVRASNGKPPPTFAFLLRKYFLHNIINIVLVTGACALAVWFWDGPNCWRDHIIIISAGALVNMLVAAFMGIVTPWSSARIGFDPSAIAGPFETALQDVVGNVFFVWFARTVIDNLSDDCGLGDCVTMCHSRIDCFETTCDSDLNCFRQNCNETESMDSAPIVCAVLVGIFTILLAVCACRARRIPK
mmetsp:Transcript_16308/g.27921  ORF Transcript_16308/g.27921 Transcript_16308/m.27921 type:complete len:336 (+) Transcript_16308:95-1102(+)